MAREPQFSSHDAPTERTGDYSLPQQEWNDMTALAQHLAAREVKMPLRRRMASFLAAAHHAGGQ